MFWILGSVLDSGTCFGSWHVFWDSGKCFGILGRVLDSGTCFGILARVLDSGTCFGILGRVLGFWDVFWILGRVLGFWDLFWILARVLDSGKCFGILGSVLDSGTCFVSTSHRRIAFIWAHGFNVGRTERTLSIASLHKKCCHVYFSLAAEHFYGRCFMYPCFLMSKLFHM